MLHSVAKEKPWLWFCVLVWLAGTPSCKRDTVIRSEEEEMYLADYETPLDKWGYMDTLGQLSIKPVFDDAGAFSEGFANVNLEGRWGFIDHDGKFLVEPLFRSAWAFHEGMARVSPFNGPEHYITRNGKTIASEQWCATDDFSEGLAKVKVGNTFGFIDTTGNLVLPAIYSRCWSFRHGMAVVSDDEKLGVINHKGEVVLPQQFTKIKILDYAGIILCNTDDSFMIYDLNGKEKYRMSDTKGIESDGTLVTIQKRGLVFFLDLIDGTILPGKGWSNVIFLGEHRWAAKEENGYVLLNEKGTRISLKRYIQINRFVNGLAAYYNGKDWGYMDAEGRELTPEVFVLAWDFKEGFARAAFSEGIAFINRKLELAFYPPPGTMDMRDFSERLAPVLMTKP